MQIHYCQTCGKLIAPALIDSGQVKVLEEKPAFCLECKPPSAVSGRSMRGTPAGGSQRNMRSTPADGSQRNIRSTPVPVRGSPAKGIRTVPAAAQSSMRNRAQSDRTSSQQNTTLVVIGLVVGGVVILGMIGLAMSSSGPSKEPGKKKDDAKIAETVKKDETPQKDLRGPGFLTSPKDQESEAKGVRGRYVRIELPGDRRPLSMAEVEVYSGEENVARKGKASQSSTAYGATADRANDGNKDGAFGNNSITHTEDEQNPWWELDLGREYDIRKIQVWNRTEENGKYLDRLKEFTVVILDTKRAPVWRRDKVPAPDPYYVLLPK